MTTMIPQTHELVSPHCRWGEVAYRRRGQLYLPAYGSEAAGAIQRTWDLVLEPLRSDAGAAVYVLPGGGYDPLRDAHGTWISHRESETTRHHLGGAVDFRVGVRRASDPWDLEWAVGWLEERLAEIGIPGGIGVYRERRNRFLHIDLRSKRGRWHD